MESVVEEDRKVRLVANLGEDVNLGPSLLIFLLLCEKLLPPSLQVGLFPRKFIQLVLEKFSPSADFFLLDFEFLHGFLVEGPELVEASKQSSLVSGLECRSSPEAKKNISLLDSIPLLMLV